MWFIVMKQRMRKQVELHKRREGEEGMPYSIFE